MTLTEFIVRCQDLERSGLGDLIVAIPDSGYVSTIETVEVVDDWVIIGDGR